MTRDNKKDTNALMCMYVCASFPSRCSLDWTGFFWMPFWKKTRTLVFFKKCLFESLFYILFLFFLFLPSIAFFLSLCTSFQVFPFPSVFPFCFHSPLNDPFPFPFFSFFFFPILFLFLFFSQMDREKKTNRQTDRLPLRDKDVQVDFKEIDFFRLEKKSLLPSWLKAVSIILNCQILHENTTWNSLYTRANRRSLGQTANFWWFSVLSEFLTKIITGASVHSTQVMACKIQPVSQVSIYITIIVPNSDAWHAHILTWCFFQSDSPMLL